MSGRSLAALFIAMMCAGISLAQERVPLIINGTTTSDFPAVGIVGQMDRGGFCTGTLVSPNHVLTAAHCAEAILDAGDGDTGTFEVANRTYRTASVSIISSYNSRQFTDDVAILVLDEPVSGVEPALLSNIPPEVGEVVSVVGFGGAGTPEEGSDGTFGVKRVGSATVDDVEEREFSWSFDDPSESNAAPGDSGGPVFIDTGEALLLAGIVSSGTTSGAGLGDVNFNMRVDAYEGFITDTINATQIVIDDMMDSAPEEEPTQEGEPAQEEEPAAEEELDEEPPTGDTDADPSTESSGGDGESSCRPRPSCRPKPPCNRPCNQVCDDSTSTTEGSTEPAADTGANTEAETDPAPDGGVDSEAGSGTDEAVSPLRSRGSSRRNRGRRGAQTRGRPRSGFSDASRNYRFESVASSRTRVNVRRR